MHHGDPPLAGDHVADLDDSLDGGLRAVFSQEVTGEPVGGCVIVAQQPGRCDHHRAGRTGGHPVAPCCDGPQPVEQHIVAGGAGAPDPSRYEDDVGVLDVGERGVDSVATAGPSTRPSWAPTPTSSAPSSRSNTHVNASHSSADTPGYSANATCTAPPFHGPSPVSSGHGIRTATRWECRSSLGPAPPA